MVRNQFPSFAKKFVMWQKKDQELIKETVFGALNKNKNYVKENVIGVPASYLDPQVFSQDDRILEDAPFLSTLVKNPNHIGCHTLEGSESFFAGTQQIERDVVEMCAQDILKAQPNSCDGYVASGGTEANIQALWIYRNYFIEEFGASHNEIGVLCSEDSHYSMAKGANLLNIKCQFVHVEDSTREISTDSVYMAVEQARGKGVKYFIVVANMMTTMFGSVDNYAVYVNVLHDLSLDFKLHVDAAFGGFYYPFSNEENELNFSNEHVSSITLDAHKMAQAPYGTGIFLSRKGLMKYARTKEASYVEGEDSTLIGSRSGANAISIWMILSKYGPYGWMEKIFILQKRTGWLCERLMEMNVEFYRNRYSNIVTIRSDQISEDTAKKFGLVPDKHGDATWFKIVVMDHVTIEKLESFLAELGQEEYA